MCTYVHGIHTNPFPVIGNKLAPLPLCRLSISLVAASMREKGPEYPKSLGI